MVEPQHVRLGDMLVAAGLIEQAQLEEALESQKTSGRRLGEELVSLGMITEVQMTQILSNQLSIPWVSLYHVELTRELLNLVPAEMAERFCAIPVYVRHVRREGDTLFVAMDDPTNATAIESLSESAGLPVRPMVAPPNDVRNAIRVYYFGGRPQPPPSPPAEGKKPEPRKEPPPPPAGAAARARSAEDPEPAADEPAAKPEAGKPEAEPAAGKPAAEPEAGKPAAEPEAPEPASEQPSGAARADRPRMITLTLLDGTSVKLPAPGSGGRGTGEGEGPEQPSHGMTAMDLVSALRARAQGADVSDVLPDEGWEDLFATLLTLLIRKGLIADWEFVDEYEKRRGRG